MLFYAYCFYYFFFFCKLGINIISFAVWGCRKKSNSGTELKIGLLRIDIFTLIDFILSMSILFSGNYSVFFSHFV